MFHFGFEGAIEHEHVNSRLAEYVAVASLRVGCDQRQQVFQRQSSDARDAGRLETGVRRTDVRIESAGGRGDGVGRDGRIWCETVGSAVGRHVGCDGVGQFPARGAEIRAGRTGGVVSRAGGRGAWVKVSVAGKRLREQPRAAHGAVGIGEQAAVGLSGEQGLPASPDRKWIGAAEEDGEDESEQRGGFEGREKRFHGGTIQTRCAALRRTSMSLMPTKGTMMPQRP